MATTSRTFNLLATMTDGSTISLTGAEAQNFWARFQAYLQGKGDERGFTYIDTTVLEKETQLATDVLRTAFLFKNVVKVEQYATIPTETTAYDCTDLTFTSTSESTSTTESETTGA